MLASTTRVKMNNTQNTEINKELCILVCVTAYNRGTEYSAKSSYIDTKICARPTDTERNKINYCKTTNSFHSTVSSDEKYQG